MRTRLFIAAVALLLLPWGGGVAHALVPSGNLLANPGAEDGEGSADGGTVPIPGWTAQNGFTAVQYAAPGFPPAPPDGGANFFAGGPEGRDSMATQTVDVSSAAPEIDARRVDGLLSGLVSPSSGPVYASVIVKSFDAAGKRLEVDYIGGFVGAPQTGFPLPRRTRSLLVEMHAEDYDQGYNSAYFDNLSLELRERRVPRPERGRSVIVKPTKGPIAILDRRGHRKGITEPTALPVGWSVDSTRGTVSIISAVDREGVRTNQGSFSQGVFAVNQGGGSDTTKLSLGGSGPRMCRQRGGQRMASRTADDFLVLAGASASRRRPGTGKAAWVAEDRCVEAKVKVRRGKVDIASTGSRRSSGGSVRRLFSRARGRFRTRGRHGAATVRGRAIVGR